MEDRAHQITKAIFDNFDADKSGTIDKAEAKNIFVHEMKKAGVTKLTFDEEQFNKWFEKADTDGNNSIDFDEALAFVKKFILHEE